MNYNYFNKPDLSVKSEAEIQAQLIENANLKDKIMREFKHTQDLLNTKMNDFADQRYTKALNDPKTQGMEGNPNWIGNKKITSGRQSSAKPNLSSLPKDRGTFGTPTISQAKK